MNLWARKARLVWLIPALLLFSCEDDINTIGLDPENNLGIFFVEVPLKDRISQVWVNDINPGSTGNLLVGSHRMNNFGLVQATSFSDILLNAADIDDNAEFDSMVLELRVNNFSGTSIGTTQIIEVYQLQDSVWFGDIEGDQTLPFRTNSTRTLGMKLGESNVFLFPDSLGLNVSETSLNSQDSADAIVIQRDYDQNGNYIYTHSIKLDDSFGQSFFDTHQNDVDSVFFTQGMFTEFFRGLGLVASANNSSIINYDAVSTFTRLALYYSITNSDGVKESQTKIFPFRPERSYNNITPNLDQPWVGSDFDDLTEFYSPFETSNDNAYLQSGTGLFTHIDISDLSQFSDTVDTYIVQNAELVIRGLESVGELNNPPSRLAYYLTNSDSLANENYTAGFITTDFSEEQPILGLYNSDENEYRISISQFLEQATDSLDLNEIVIAPVTINSNNALIIENSQVRGFVVPKENMSIRFFYTVPENN